MFVITHNTAITRVAAITLTSRRTRTHSTTVTLVATCPHGITLTCATTVTFVATRAHDITRTPRSTATAEPATAGAIGITRRVCGATTALIATPSSTATAHKVCHR